MEENLFETDPAFRVSPTGLYRDLLNTAPFTQHPNETGQPPVTPQCAQLPNAPLPCSHPTAPNQYNELPNQYNELPNQYNELPNQYNELPNQYNELPNQYNELPNQYNELPHGQAPGGQPPTGLNEYHQTPNAPPTMDMLQQPGLSQPPPQSGQANSSWALTVYSLYTKKVDEYTKKVDEFQKKTDEYNRIILEQSKKIGSLTMDGALADVHHRHEVAELHRQIAELKLKVEDLEANQKKRPGPKPGSRTAGTGSR